MEPVTFDAPNGAVTRPPGRAARRRMPAHAAALLLLLALPGCVNPFAPAKSEPPSTESDSFQIIADFATPEGVLTSLAEAVAAKGRGNGSSTYMASFADSASDGVGLTVLFDPEVVTERQNAGKVVPPWTRALEQQFYRYLVSLNPGEYTLSWTRYDGAPADQEDDATGLATLTRQYQVYALASDGVSATSIAWGRAELQMRKLSATRWTITRWTDTVDPTYGPDPRDAGFRSFSRLRIDSTGQ